jgi:hypothetical protein
MGRVFFLDFWRELTRRSSTLQQLSRGAGGNPVASLVQRYRHTLRDSRLTGAKSMLDPDVIAAQLDNALVQDPRYITPAHLNGQFRKLKLMISLTK